MEFDLLIIGSGLAGLYAALQFGERGRIGLITKRALTDGATAWAQGGIAAATAPDDDVDLHAADTIGAGAGLCHDEVVRAVVREGPARVAELAELGVSFSRKQDGRYDLGIEGGHSRRRIFHASDLTGEAIEDALIDMISGRSNVDIFENSVAVELIVDPDDGNRCWGAYVLETANGDVLPVVARATILASGGAGKVYLITSNPDVATGDGVAMAWRAGAAIANMEFFQFHPTCLFVPGAKTFSERSFLLSEALRGEGCILINEAGERFMSRYAAQADLAPRDVVARAIDQEMKAAGTDHVYLDARPLGKERLQRRFPYIYARCLEYGIDLSRDPAPVAPAAHYCCGGVQTDIRGRTNLPSLYAAGEVACTGLHGANRLASNSLLEAAVFAKHAIDAAGEDIAARRPFPSIPAPSPAEGTAPDPAVISHDWYFCRRTMRDLVGIVRSDRRLQIADERLRSIENNVEKLYRASAPAIDIVELRNIVTIARLIVKSALARRESRGLHYNVNHPERDDFQFKKDTVLCRECGNGDK